LFVAALLLCVVSSVGFCGETIKLWPNGAPGAKGTEKNDSPTLTLCPVAGKQNTPAVLLCPGGGYKHISGHRDHAKWFNSLGVAVYALKYRLPVHGYQHPAPLQDAQRAMRMIRYNAEKWGLDSKRIGVMGFSSGGHVASTLMTHFDKGDPKAKDPIDKMPCHADFGVLQCPVVTFGTFVHAPSKTRLLGKNPSAELVKDLSNELQVTEETPPSFLAHCKDDRLVKPENSQLFYDAMVKAGVKAEIKLYEEGGHGVKGPDGRSLWYDDCATWLRKVGLL